jgi:hypothetical protein
MKTPRILILSLALMGLSVSASAGTPHFAAIDADGDGAFVAGMDVNGDTVTDYKDIDIKASEYDCDDSSANKSPLLDEVYDDGLDNDCDATTADTLPMTEPERTRFAANEYKGDWDATVFVVEHARCTAGAALTAPTCEVDGTNGVFKILLPDDIVFEDIYRGDTHIIARDGKRELVSVEAAANAQHVFEEKAAAARPVYRGPSKATRQGEIRDALVPLREESLEGDIELGLRIDEVETANETRDDVLNEHGVALGQLFDNDDILTDAVVNLSEQSEEADRKEREERIQADGELAADIEDARVARSALRQEQARQADTVTELSTSGFAINGGVIGGVQLQRELTANGDTLRGPAMGGVGMDLTVHLDLDDALIGGFGSAMWGSDGTGSGADEAYLLGFEALGDIQDSGHHLGGFVAYRHTEGHSNLLDVNVPADGACGGASYRFQAPYAGHVTVSPFARVGVCGEVYGSKGWQEGDGSDLNLVVTRGQGIGATALVGVSFSATSVLDR